MARRRSTLPRNLILLGALAAAAVAGWRFGPGRPAPGGPASADACRLAPAPRLAETIGRVAVEARRLPPAAGVPAAAGCSWTYFGGRAEGRVFSAASLAAGGVALSPPDYFRSIATGLEYEFKVAPRPVDGLGDEALVAGFAGGDRPQVVVRRGERVLVVAFEGLAEEQAIAFMRGLAEGL